VLPKTPVSPSRGLFVLVAALAFALIAAVFVREWSPDTGITHFINLGREFNQRGVAAYRTAPKYMDPFPPNRYGFDGQWYAQMALDPLLRDPQTRGAIDNPPYRARRILLPWLAWLGGLGRPAWVLNVYAALNPLFWIGFAFMMARLFRPWGWRGLAGFAAMLLTCGVIESMWGSLTDFPAWVLMTLAVMIGETAGAGVLALAFLTREVSALGIVGLFEFPPPWPAAIKKNFRLGLIVGLPFLLWFAYFTWRFHGMVAAAGGENMDWPLRAIGQKLAEVAGAARQGDIVWLQFYKSEPLHAVLTVVATLTQCVYLLTHRRWENRLWRVGVAFVPAFLCIGFPQWVHHFTITRQALPITLAFNLILAMRPGRRWLVWFLLGNCFVPYGIYKFATYDLENPQVVEFFITGSRMGEAAPTIRAAAGWETPERNRRRIWRWASQPQASLVVQNPSPHPIGAELSFTTMSFQPRDFRVKVQDRVVWSGHLDGKNTVQVQTAGFTLPPGVPLTITLETPQPPAVFAADDSRSLTFMVAGLQLTEDPPAAPGAR
jgi:hypothetical protein